MDKVFVDTFKRLMCVIIKTTDKLVKDYKNIKNWIKNENTFTF